MKKRGMKAALHKFSQRKVEIIEEITELAREINDTLKPVWNDRIVETEDALAALPRCEVHKGFSKKCEMCVLTVPHREEKAKLKGKLKTFLEGFNAASSHHWRWYFFDYKQYHLVERKGVKVPRPGLDRTEGNALSTSDDALLLLYRKLLLDDIDDPLIGKRVRIGKLQKKMSTYINPFLYDPGVEGSGALLNTESFAFPQYNDAATRTGRWSGGGTAAEEEGK
jgi:hypothetical protein